MKPFEIVDTPIESQKYADYVLHAGAGAVTIFTGNVGNGRTGFGHYTFLMKRMSQWRRKS